MPDRCNGNIIARKLSFEEAWETATVFFNDEHVEAEIDKRIETLHKEAEKIYFIKKEAISADDVTDVLQNSEDGLRILRTDILLSQEKFLRIISLLRKLQLIPGGFESEWSIERVKSLIRQDRGFASTVAEILLDGHSHPLLIEHLPRYYREKLNLRLALDDPPQKRRLKLKESVTGTYAALKGHSVEERINDEIKRCGKTYAKGRSPIIDTDVDMAIPTLSDPYIVIMVTYQETTSSGQTTKARDMYNCNDRIRAYNNRNNENRIFINFADGGGWLARKNDFKRLVENCDYFLNLNNIGMLRPIIEKHLPS